ncbi:diaminobutyrate acetyltransferase [Streptomyces tsukubensis]|uniref:L-2,4-diaminobutyric acid acetyltransferase n=1 Tax=Streptomyces tsukubensis TaxID=83656 RepID=A0A1V4A2W8_9ACTN|nr:diaminobutyrate acetyltransferase [Streptomyces tsukubensis]OON73991.1 diaminobutyrate acetyltransferase [Streptomyces tsukubensis]QFR92965.1 diaminobutyrate acetyltransferase [Streptomyces tsukubensis]
MTAAQADLARARTEFREMPEGLRLDGPEVEDGATIWRIARDSKTLDLNSSYSYLLWCRDFAGTSVVARDSGGDPVGFITGYIRPDRPQTLVVWQVAVDASQRGRGLAAAMLDGLIDRISARQELVSLETTIAPGNVPSERLFTSFGRRSGATVEREVLFDAGLFPDGGHDPEVLYRIGPLAPGRPPAPEEPAGTGVA